MDELSTLRTSAAPPEPTALHRMVAQLVLETTNEGIWLIDAQARTTFVNHAAAALLGYAVEEMLGRHVFDFMSAERRPSAQRGLMARQRGVEDRHELTLRRKDGSSVWVIASANPVYDHQGRYAGALALIGDLSKQKEVEERLRRELEALRAQQPKVARASGARSWLRSSLRGSLRDALVVTAGAVTVSVVSLLAAAGVVGGLVHGKPAGGQPRSGQP